MQLSDILNAYKKTTDPMFIYEGQEINTAMFTQHVSHLYHQLACIEFECAILVTQDIYLLSVTIIAVAILGKPIVFPPNHQPGTLKAFTINKNLILNSEKIQSWITSKTEAKTLPLNKFDLQTISLYTSGTTGESKKITRCFRTLQKEILALEKTFGKKMQSKQIYTSVSACHMYGLIFALLWPLLTGRTIACQPLLFPADIERIIKNNLDAVIVCCPSLLSRLSIITTPNQRALFFSSGAELKVHDAEFLQKILNITPIEIFGSTETGAIGFRTQSEDELWQRFLEVNLIADSNDIRYAVSSPFFDEELPIVLDDEIERINNHQFKLLGRKSRLAKVEGKRLSLDAMENTLKSHELIQDVHVCMMDGQRQWIIAAVVLKETGVALLAKRGKYQFSQQIKKWLNQYYDAILLPKKIKYVPVIPRNQQGKVKRADIMTVLGVSDATFE